jgi:hypothetical protein
MHTSATCRSTVREAAKQKKSARRPKSVRRLSERQLARNRERGRELAA